jgi:hypothetical protein
MEAIYFGNAHWQGNTGAGQTGPWAGADLEQGMYYGGGAATKVNNQSQPLTHDFVSLSLKGRTDGFTLKGGDATVGTLATMYDGPRPDATLAGRCGGGKGHNGGPITLQKCTEGSSSQTWGFEKDGMHIANGNVCLDINNFRKFKGAEVWAYECRHGPKPTGNELWELKDDTIPSLQAETPFCLGMTGAAVGSTAQLDECTALHSEFTIGFTNTSGTTSTIVQKSSGLCLTTTPFPPSPGSSSQPMRNKGAIILATGGDNSNGAQGNFYEGFMTTGYASDATDAAVQANIVAVGYSGFSYPHY